MNNICIPKVTFGFIVLNGQPFLEYNLRYLYAFAHQIIVVEGACIAASSMATQNGHSLDGTLDFLLKAKEKQDPENKIILVTAEDEGRPNGFWDEKDQMSQAYASRTTGDWLWQVDYDEFYLEEDIEKILRWLKNDPSVDGFSFPFHQFWGSFHSVEKGEFLSYRFPSVRRLFKWGPGYRYIQHRPPTVVDSAGIDLSKKRWISHCLMQQQGIYMYHFSCVFPRQAYQRVGYYQNVRWTKDFEKNNRWVEDVFYGLKTPLFLGESKRRYYQWLEPFDGRFPDIIQQMIQDIEAGVLDIPLRDTRDIERLLSSKKYHLQIAMVRVRLFLENRVLFIPQIYEYMIYPLKRFILRKIIWKMRGKRD